MINWLNCHAVERAKGCISDYLAFAGSRVPITALFENLEDGVTA